MLLNVAWLSSSISSSILIPSAPLQPSLLFFWFPFIPSSPPDAYHCSRSIKCNVCRRAITGNMWWELKMLSHFKLPIICSKGAWIVLQSACKNRKDRRWTTQRPTFLSCTLLTLSVHLFLAFAHFIIVLFVCVWRGWGVGSYLLLLMLHFVHFLASLTSLSSVIICHGERATSLEKKKNRQGITGMWTQD